MSRPWSFPVALDPESREPLAQQIARAVAGDVRRGRLRAGALLPGSRSLAASLGVHRNTVLAAYRELAAEGWIEAGQRSTRVAEAVAVERRAAPRAPGPRAEPGFAFETLDLALRPEPRPRGALFLGGGFPDVRLVPADLLARAVRRVLRGRSAPLGYGDPQGDLRFREALSRMLAEARGLAFGPGELVVTSGSLMGLDLVARTLLKPGEAVAVEDPGYPQAWATLRAAGAELVPVPVDAQGLDVEALEALLARRTVRAVYTTPHHQFPTTATLSAPRRLRLLELARRHRVAVIEDDHDFEFHYEGRPVLPLASADGGGVVVYLGSLSKVLAPGLRLGYVGAPAALATALAARRAVTDYHGNQVFERAVAELLEDGLLQRHVRKVRRTNLERRDVLVEALRQRLPDRLQVEAPGGGMSLWVRVEGLPKGRWSRRCREEGVLFPWGSAFDFHGEERPFIRLGFTALDPRELREAVRRMAAAM